MKVLIFLGEDRLTPRGGPYAVGYYINEERKKAGDDFIEFLPHNESYNRTHEKGRKLTDKLPKFFNKIHRTLRRIRRNYKIICKTPKGNTFDFSPYDVVHFHETQDLYMQRENLKEYKGIVLFTSHSPIPFHQEYYTDLSWLENSVFRFIYKKAVNLDRYSFSRADYIVFPCEEAREPYFDNWSEFAEIAKRKQESFKYVLTGIPAAKAKREGQEVRRELGIKEEEFIACYVGRHNKVKGYASLLQIGEKALERWQDIQFVIAGREEPLKGLAHERWHEVGWTTDAHSYIAVADVFILPNEATYFDIVMLEVLSLGCVVIASRTGGNKYFEKEGVHGVLLYDTKEEALALIERVKAMSKEERIALGQTNKAYYEAHLTSETMYNSYVALLKEVYEEGRKNV